MTKQEAEALVQDLIMAEEGVVVAVCNGKPKLAVYRLIDVRNHARNRIIAALCSGPEKEETDADTENA